MKTKKITLSIPELCAKLGIDATKFEKFELVIANQNSKCLIGTWHIAKTTEEVRPTLSINDLFPTDECETCRKPYDKHGVGESCYNTTESSLPSSLLSLFKPRLAKVVGLRMVERCEWCKRIEEDHDEGDKGERWCRHSYLPKEEHLSGRSYKPVQEVEVEVK